MVNKNNLRFTKCKIRETLFIILVVSIAFFFAEGGCGSDGKGDASKDINTVTSGGDGTINLSPDKESYEQGTEVTIEANPATNNVFKEWYGSDLLSRADEKQVITFQGRMKIGARFLPRFIEDSFTQLNKIEKISRFRSAIGHDYSDNVEDNRSMKHYYEPNSTYRKNNEIKIFSPIEGTISSIINEQHGSNGELTNKQIRIESEKYPDIKVVIFHSDLVSTDIREGKRVSSGDHLGYARMYYPDLDEYAHNFDIAVWLNKRYISYFNIVSDDLFQSYQSRGVETREEFIISKEERDNNPIGDPFEPTGNLENWVYLK